MMRPYKRRATNECNSETERVSEVDSDDLDYESKANVRAAVELHGDEEMGGEQTDTEDSNDEDDEEAEEDRRTNHAEHNDENVGMDMEQEEDEEEDEVNDDENDDVDDDDDDDESSEGSNNSNEMLMRRGKKRRKKSSSATSHSSASYILSKSTPLTTTATTALTATLLPSGHALMDAGGVEWGLREDMNTRLMRTMNEILVSHLTLTRKVDQLADNYYKLDRRIVGKSDRVRSALVTI